MSHIGAPVHVFILSCVFLDGDDDGGAVAELAILACGCNSPHLDAAAVS